jgi:hypothetical protein
LAGCDGTEDVTVGVVAVTIGRFLHETRASFGSICKLRLVDVITLVNVFAASDRISIPNIMIWSGIPILSGHLVGALDVAIGKLICLAEGVVGGEQGVALILLSS